MAHEMIPSPNPEYFTHEFVVDESALDHNHHVNNVVFIQWIQDYSILHSDVCGSTAVTDAMGCTWMIFNHHVEYKAQAFLGDKIKLTTWVSDYARASCKRRCRFERVSDGTVVLESETIWAFIDAKRGRLTAIPENVKLLFQTK